jgi:hypothetical protein
LKTEPSDSRLVTEKFDRLAAIEALELPTELAEYLTAAGSNVLLVWGPTGSGKSSLSAELLRGLDGKLILVTPSGIGPDERLSAFTGSIPESRIFHVQTESESQLKNVPDERGGGRLFAAGLFDGGSERARPAWVQSVLAQLSPTEPSYIVVDHWRPTPAGKEGNQAEILSTSANADRDIQFLRVALEGSLSHLILLADIGPHDEPISSADGAIETGYEALPSGRIRTLTLHKLRGVQIRAAQYPYTLAEGRFRCILPLLPDYRPPVGPPDAPVSERSGFLWPGSAEFVRVFGWLRLGAFSALEMGNSVPDYVESSLATPMVAHTILSGGRVVWVPLPACLPEEIAQRLLQWVPQEKLTNGLRLLSAGGSETDPLMKEILMPLPAAPASPTPSSGAPSARVAPAFAEAYRFLQEKPSGTPALFVLSMDGLRALAAVTGVHYDPATFPLIVARYAQIPGFHGFTFTPEGDQLGATARGHAERILRADFRHGRVFVTGVRPETLPQALAWSEGDKRYQLVQMS